LSYVLSSCWKEVSTTVDVNNPPHAPLPPDQRPPGPLPRFAARRRPAWSKGAAYASPLRALSGCPHARETRGNEIGALRCETTPGRAEKRPRNRAPARYRAVGARTCAFQSRAPDCRTARLVVLGGPAVEDVAPVDVVRRRRLIYRLGLGVAVTEDDVRLPAVPPQHQVAAAGAVLVAEIRRRHVRVHVVAVVVGAAGRRVGGEWAERQRRIGRPGRPVELVVDHRGTFHREDRVRGRGNH